MNFWFLLSFAMVGSVGLTGLVRRYALSRRLLDIPNKRSSHTVPVPRGGGLAIVLVFLGCLPVLLVLGVLSAPVLISFTGAGGLVAVVGFLDDHSHVPARWRLLAHFIGAGWGLAWLGGLPPLPMLGFSLDMGWLGQLLAAVYLVWLLNLYNFMDGIDGIAAIETITVCLGGALVYALAVPDGTGWVVPVLLLAAVAGFLFWNFPPARIFMGDAGSGFLGLILGLLSIQAAWVEPELFWSWLILLGVFIVDATVTLIRRILRGDKFYEAHRSHAYQNVSRKVGAHKPVSLAVGAINLFWLLPLAALVAHGAVDGVLGVLIAYVPLIGLAFRFKAGEEGNKLITGKKA